MAIDGIIPNQKFSIVRDKIADILSSEFENQEYLTGDADLAVTVQAGRSRAIDKTEVPFINVMIGRMSFDNSNQGQDDNLVTYYIDVYAKAKASAEKAGDLSASDKLLKYLSVARVILNNPLYRTLGFAPGFIGMRTIRDIEMEDPQNTHDAVVTQRARILFDVKMLETADTYQEFVQVGSSHTQVKLGDTEKGYRYEYEKAETFNLVAFSGDNLVSFSGDNLISLN